MWYASNFEFLDQNLKSKFPNFVKIGNFEVHQNCKSSKFKFHQSPNLMISSKFVKLSKIWNFRCQNWQNSILGLRTKIWIWARVKDFKFSIFAKIQNLTKNQNSATVVYHNFAILTKFENQNFPKFVPIWRHKRDKPFPKFLKSISKSQNHQNWLSSPKFCKKKFLKPWLIARGDGAIGAMQRRPSGWCEIRFWTN